MTTFDTKAIYAHRQQQRHAIPTPSTQEAPSSPEAKEAPFTPEWTATIYQQRRLARAERSPK
ncbi:hypothetical protein [Bradyrhizobium sp. USDA 3256]